MKKLFRILQVILIIMLLLLLAVTFLDGSPACKDPFHYWETYIGFVLCGILGFLAWSDLQDPDSGSWSAYFMLILSILLPIVLGLFFRSWTINILDFFIFNGIGFVSAIKMSKKFRKENTPSAANAG